MLCRKTVDLFTLLSHTGETATTERMGMTQDLLSLVTGLAHYLKILIRIALTAALKLDRDFGRNEALFGFLDKLQLLASGGGNPSARRVVPSSKPQSSEYGPVVPSGTQGVSYGYKSLAPENAGESPFIGRSAGPNGANGVMSTPPSDLCLQCAKTVEEDCVRLGTYNRWHSNCLVCVTCGRDAMDPATAAALKEKEKNQALATANGENPKPAHSSTRRPPPRVQEFLFVTDYPDGEAERHPPTVICCVDHPFPRSRVGFAAVSRLEQFAFLLNVALRRLYLLLLRRNVMPLASSVPPPTQHSTHSPRPSLGEGDIMPMKSMHLDRKLSATAKVPQKSMIVESPTTRVAQPTDVQHGQKHYSGSPSTPRDKKNGKPPPVSTSPEQVRPQPNTGSPESPSSPGAQSPSTIIRPPFARNNTQIAIIDLDSDTSESNPSNAGVKTPRPRSRTGNQFDEEGITLGDIPQFLESEQAREQHRSLPRQGDQTTIAELTPLELFIVKHFAVLALLRSPLKDQFDLDEILELIEAKKSTFWNKIFKGNDKKNIKKKGWPTTISNAIELVF